jgi:hypothetical protein
MTAKEIQLGDDQEHIVEQYGTEYYTRQQVGATFIGYLDKNENKVIEFAMDGNKVKLITVSEFSVIE